MNDFKIYLYQYQSISCILKYKGPKVRATQVDRENKDSFNFPIYRDKENWVKNSGALADPNFSPSPPFIHN